ncbi:hypothetical protein HED60_21600 [Planctomycetales bacterium ZRK34]|nr:hypothetical protein HED60_21600 [Planctomycetales bacterium ZRK34]
MTDPLAIQRDAKFTELVMRYLEGQLTEDQADQLREAMAADPDRRQTFVLMCYESRLLAEATAGEVESFKFKAPVDAPSPMPRRSRSVGVLIAAALVVLALTAWFVLSPEPQTPTAKPSTTSSPSVAMLTNLSADAVFAEDRDRMQLGSELTTGPIKLAAGRAQLMFKSAAVVDLAGPCEFEMTGPNRGRLAAGMLEAYVPESARGFTLDLPDGSRIIDLGTKFGIQTQDLEAPRVEVYDGSVRVEMVGGQSQILLAGQAAQLAGGRLTSIGRSNLLVNGDFEPGDPDKPSPPQGWTVSQGDWWLTDGQNHAMADPPSARRGQSYVTASRSAAESGGRRSSAESVLTQTVELSADDLAFAQQDGVKVELHFFYCAADPHDRAGVWIELLDSSGAVLQSMTRDRLETTAEAAWTPGQVSLPLVAGTRSIRVRLQANRRKMNDTNVNFDHVRLTLSAPYVVAERATRPLSDGSQAP